MAGVGRWAGFVLGLVIVGVTFSIVVGTILLPKGVRSRIAYAVWRAVSTPFMAAAGRMRRHESKDRLLGLLGPVSLLALLGAWLLLLLLGYALLLLPLTGDGFKPRRGKTRAVGGRRFRHHCLERIIAHHLRWGRSRACRRPAGAFRPGPPRLGAAPG